MGAIHTINGGQWFAFGAICPAEGKGAGLVMPFRDAEAVQAHLVEISAMVAPDAHAVLLLDQIPPEQEIGSVTADGAYDTRKCHDVIAARGAAAIIPPRKNAKPWKPDTAGAIARNDILRLSKRLCRTIWRRWSGYRRSTPSKKQQAPVRSAPRFRCGERGSGRSGCRPRSLRPPKW